MVWPDWIKPDLFLKLFEHRLLLFGIFTVCAVVWFLPLPAANYLHVADFREAHRTAISLVGGSALVLWIVQLWPFVAGRVQSSFYGRSGRREILKNLDTLSAEEMFIFAYCLDRNQRTVTLYPFGQRATALVHKGLLRRAPYGTLMEFAHTIPGFVWEELQKRKASILPQDEDELEALRAEFEQFDELPRLHR